MRRWTRSSRRPKRPTLTISSTASRDGYDTAIGERGARLSGGERQRICVARAFLKNAAILILDEPTSSIDSRTEAVILDALDRLMIGRTTFMIAHRLSTIRHADLILDAGSRQTRGSRAPTTSCSRSGGLYAQLHDVQTRQRERRLRDGHSKPSPEGSA